MSIEDKIRAALVGVINTPTGQKIKGFASISYPYREIIIMQSDDCYVVQLFRFSYGYKFRGKRLKEPIPIDEAEIIASVESALKQFAVVSMDTERTFILLYLRPRKET